MAEKLTIDAMWDDSPIDVSTEVNFIWSIANKLRGTYQSDKYKDVIIPMVIIRRFECALAPTKKKVMETFAANPNYPAKAMYRVSGYQFYNTSGFDLAELVNDSEHLAANFKAYIQGFSANIQDIIRSLDFDKQIDKMDKNNRLLSVVKAFSELDLDPRTIDNVKMGYIFEELIRKFSENAEAGDHYTGRDIIKLMVNILLAEGCDDIFDDGKVITVLDQACGTGGMLSTSYNFIKRYNPTADVRLFGQEINPESYAICLLAQALGSGLPVPAGEEPKPLADKKLMEKIADGLSVMDKKAEIQRDRKGNIIYDKETKDTELVKYEEDIDDYMAREVLPHIPDAVAFFEENLGAKKPVVKTGAEIPFTRYFYKYQEPVASDDLEVRFMELELSVTERVAKLFD